VNAFIDTNVLLDVLANRAPFYVDAAAVWTLAEQGRIRGLVSAVSFTNIYYIVRKLRDHRTAQRTLVMLRDTFTPVACDERVLNQALDASFKDFEDAVQYFSAVQAEASVLITRNADHFPSSGALVIATPAEFPAARSFEGQKPAT
jgi:predicted nucleic acid-binding protein